MNTSYFAKYKGNNGVSIALKSPYWFKGDEYKELAPTPQLLSEYKSGLVDENGYMMRYQWDVLDKLDPQKVYDDLKDKVLLCWEGKGKFCHRRLVANWIEHELGIEVKEL
ncbi:MAG: hypothetical protein ACOCZ5_03520 [bacterium]